MREFGAAVGPPLHVCMHASERKPHVGVPRLVIFIEGLSSSSSTATISYLAPALLNVTYTASAWTGSTVGGDSFTIFGTLCTYLA